MQAQYSKKTIKYFHNPKNFGVMKNPDGKNDFKSPVCGDVTTFYIKVRNDKISKISFTTLGCAVSIATASVLTELVKGKNIDKVKGINPIDIAKKLGGIPPIKLHCAVMAVNALKGAIEDYDKKNK